MVTPHTEFVKSVPPKLHPNRSANPDRYSTKVTPNTEPENITPNADPEKVTPNAKGYLGNVLDGGLLLALLLLALLLRGRPRLPLHRRFEMLRFGVRGLAISNS